MQIRIWTTLCILSLSVVSCSQPGEAVRGNGPLRVTVGTEPGIGMDVRTALDEDGFTIRWVKGDRIALWATNDAGEAQFSAVPFQLYSFDETYQSGKFTGTVDPMPEGSYTYCALSPVPASTEGTKGIYTIPAVQDGAFHSEWDIMTAAPVRGGAFEDGDNSAAVTFAFSHKMHLLKIRIPENRLGEPVTGLEIAFPVPVTGTLKVDANDPDATPELVGGSNTLTLEFGKPVEPNDIVYAMIAPVEIDKSLPVSLFAFGETRGSKTIRIPGKNFAAGHSTPIAFSAPEAEQTFTTLLFSLDGTGEGTLGEKVGSFTITGPEGSDVGNGTNTRSFEVNETGIYKSVFRHGFSDGLSGETLSVSYESENAIVTNTFSMPALTAETSNTIPALKIPYLLEEKFDTVETYTDNEGTTGINDPAAIWIPGLSGWSAARTGGVAGQSVRIAGHREGAWGVGADYEARMDSAPLSGLKEGANVTVKINFDYSGSTNKGAPHLKYGTSNAQGLISGANADIESQAGNITTNTNGSYTTIDQAVTPFTASATNKTRVTWVAYGTDKTSGFTTVYFFYYVYIDNVTVSIVP